MHSHQRLHVFLPRLHAELVRNGMSRDTAKFTCKAMRAGAGLDSPEREARGQH